MRPVTRNQYTRIMTHNIDRMHDIAFSVAVPPNTGVTVHDTFTVPAGYVGVLRNVSGNVSATTSAGQSKSLLRITRPGQPLLHIFELASDAGGAGASKTLSLPMQIILPEGTLVESCYSNGDPSLVRTTRQFVAIDLIRL